VVTVASRCRAFSTKDGDLWYALAISWQARNGGSCPGLAGWLQLVHLALLLLLGKTGLDVFTHGEHLLNIHLMEVF